MINEECGHLKEWMSGNIFIRQTRLESIGNYTDGHTHNFDHTTIFFQGSFRVTATLTDGSQVIREFTAPDYVLIKADVLHRIEALQDNSIYWCVYSHRDAQGEVVQKSEGFGPAYY